MAVWLVRAGEHSQFDEKFINDQRVYLTCKGVSDEDFTEISDYSGIRKLLLTRLQGGDDFEIASLSDVVFEFVMSMATHDLVITPLRTSNSLAIGEIVSPYGFDPTAEPPFNHLRDVKWIAMDIPTQSFSAEIQTYLNMTAPVVQIKVSNAAAQVQKIVSPQQEFRLEPHISASTIIREKNDPTKSTPSPTKMAPSDNPPIRVSESKPVSGVTQTVSDLRAVEPDECLLESLGIQAITQVIGEDFARNGPHNVVRAILEAGGLTIISQNMESDSSLFTAAPGSFGLDRPITCVWVPPANTTCDALSFSQFLGRMQANQCDQGLIVAWSGFESQAIHGADALATKVRLWNQQDIVKNFVGHYAALGSNIQQRIPLKRIWIPSSLI